MTGRRGMTGPLQRALRQSRELREQADAFFQECRKADLDPEKKKSLNRRCLELKTSVDENAYILQNLKKADEPAPVGNYNQRKEEEERQLLTLLQKLERLSTLLNQENEDKDSTMDGKRQDSSKTQQKNEDIQEEDEEESIEDEEEEEEEGEDDSDDYEEEEEDELDYSSIKHFISLGDFAAQQEGDLTFKAS